MRSILFVFAAFAGMISFMVYRCMQTPVDLVSKEYYKDELAYQQVIDGKKQAAGLSGKITLQWAEGRIILQLPPEMKHAGIKGSLLFYCSYDAAKDRTILLSPDATGRQDINSRSLLPGHYTVRIEWESRGVRYYAEEPFVMSPAAAVPGA